LYKAVPIIVYYRIKVYISGISMPIERILISVVYIIMKKEISGPFMAINGAISMRNTLIPRRVMMDRGWIKSSDLWMG
jgi:hypothetical protein